MYHEIRKLAWSGTLSLCGIWSSYPSGRTVSIPFERKEGEQLLRKDLKELCALFRHLGKDSLIIACLAYQVGPYRLLGYGKMPKSTLIRKLESGNRDIYADFVKYCHYKGKKIPSIERRRKEEYERLFVP